MFEIKQNKHNYNKSKCICSVTVYLNENLLLNWYTGIPYLMIFINCTWLEKFLDFLSLLQFPKYILKILLIHLYVLSITRNSKIVEKLLEMC